MNMRSSIRVLAALMMALALVSSVSAQKKTREERKEEATTRSVLGTVTGPDDQPISGAVVQVKDMRSLQIRSFITQADGSYHFYGLKDDIDYQLTAKFDDMTAGPKPLSIFDNRKEAVLNFKLDKKK